jgi:hypothetical protein
MTFITRTLAIILIAVVSSCTRRGTDTPKERDHPADSIATNNTSNSGTPNGTGSTPNNNGQEGDSIALRGTITQPNSPTGKQDQSDSIPHE